MNMVRMNSIILIRVKILSCLNLIVNGNRNIDLMLKMMKSMVVR